MAAKTAHFDVQAIQASWQALEATTHLRSIASEAEYNHAILLMNALLDVVGEDEDHALSALLDVVADLIWKYEQENYAIDPHEPK